MNKIWSIMIITSFALAIYMGNIKEVIAALFESSKTVIDMCLNIMGIICLWSGFMKIAEKCGIIDKMSKLVRPIIKFLFPELKQDSEASGHIAMNMTANLLGLGNVATPLGLKAMEAMQKNNNNKEVISNSMIMLIVLNTASIQLIPTSVIALRTTYGSSNPAIVVLPILVASIVSVIAAISLVKIFCKKETK